jgi:ribosomal protein S18 acetylase RimI-like enzyme
MLIRPARPEDASFLAQAILIAGRAHVTKGIWEVVLGGTEEECVAFLHHLAITNIPHLFHYSYYLIAEDDEARPIGSLGSYDPEISGYQALQRAIPEVVEKLRLAAGFADVLEERAAKILVCLPEAIAGAWVIDSVATLPEHRGKGVAENLLTRILAIGKQQGYSKAQVNMYIGNEPALHLYHKFGFAIIEETRDAYFEQQISSPGVLSLAKDL